MQDVVILDRNCNRNKKQELERNTKHFTNRRRIDGFDITDNTDNTRQQQQRASERASRKRGQADSGGRESWMSVRKTNGRG